MFVATVILQVGEENWPCVGMDGTKDLAVSEAISNDIFRDELPVHNAEIFDALYAADENKVNEILRPYGCNVAIFINKFGGVL